MPFAWRGTVSPTKYVTLIGQARGLQKKPPKVSMCGWRDRLARWEPESSLWERLRFEEARRAFRDQIEALAEGGVDLLMMETFGYLEELHQAMLAAKDVGVKLPLVVQVTIDEDGNCLDGSNPETFAPRLEEWGADVIGCNCSVGPVAMLDAIERVRAATSLPLAAQPNAGIPRSVEGRNIYLCSPEYMASYARKFVAAGARIVGGCCGTTPDHIRVMKSALRVGEAQRKDSRGPGCWRHDHAAGDAGSADGGAIALGRQTGAGRVRDHGGGGSSQRNRHPQGAGRFAIPEIGGVDAVNIPDSPRASARMSNQALSLLVQREAGSTRFCITPVATATCCAFRVICWERRRSGSGT